MSTKTPKGKSRDLYFSKYATSKLYASNRQMKLERLLKQQPNNEQIKKALENINYRRATPKVPTWSHSDIATAKLFKYFTGKFDKGVLIKLVDERSTNTYAAAVHTRNQNIFDHYKAPKFNQNSMFSLKERAHSNNMRVWI
jgi:hypothetical protein